MVRSMQEPWELPRLTPVEELPQVRLGVHARDTPVARQVRDSRHSDLARARRCGVEGRHRDTVGRRARTRQPPVE